MPRLFHVDAFASRPFEGNPAAVCLLDCERPDEWLQSVAAEMNLSETAFVLRDSNGYSLRWFTPVAEVPLCGHATLASAHVLWETGTLSHDEAAIFQTRSGQLKARQLKAQIEMVLPAAPVTESPAPAGALEALGVTPTWVGRTSDRGMGDVDILLVLESEDAVRRTRPNFGRLRGISAGFIVSARAASAPFDFVSRYFAPFVGIDEDPVTGAAHCALVPYWSAQLGKSEMTAFQASARGGVVRGRTDGDRVRLFGEAVTVLRGELLA
jgi:PhzF family phenazine biosynthesis protein